jgi:hypothetical protein
MASMAAIKAVAASACAASAHVTLAKVMSNPARAGPTNRAVLNKTEPIATAEATSALGTISSRIADRADS